MVINAVCQNCKRVYPLDEQYAGQTFSCETCGQPFTVPTPGVVQPIPEVPANVNYASASQPGEVTREHFLAGRICIVLSVLMYLAFACITCGGIITLFVPAGPARIVGAIFIALALFVGAVATTYLICGLRIRQGGHIAVIVALILAGLHELLIVAGLVFGTIGAAMQGLAGKPAQFIISFIIQLTFAIALGQLIYYLIKILRQPRNTY